MGVNTWSGLEIKILGTAFYICAGLGVSDTKLKPDDFKKLKTKLPDFFVEVERPTKW